jgi:hypothetical protein
MQHALLFSNSILGAGLYSALSDLPDWICWHATPSCPEHMVEGAERYRPHITLFDMTCLPVVRFFEVFGQARIREFGAILVVTLSGLEEEDLFRLSMWGVAAHISGDTRLTRCRRACRSPATSEPGRASAVRSVPAQRTGPCPSPAQRPGQRSSPISHMAYRSCRRETALATHQAGSRNSRLYRTGNEK